MSEEEETVFLEDLQAQVANNQEEQTLIPASQESNISVKSTRSNASKSNATSNVRESKKRQATLTDMFGGQGAKRQKLTPQRPTTSGSTTVKTAASSSKLSRPDGSQKLNAIPFSLKAFQDSLDEDQRNLLDLECQVLGKSWLKLLHDEIKKPYFISLKRFLWERGVQGPNAPAASVFPSPRDIYAWSNTPLGKVKVVLIGQDPYHGRGQAHGLCFSVPTGARVPPSLNNIYAELRSEYPDFEPPKHGNLSCWAANGVLMLNACLTVEEGKAGSHANKGWEAFTSKVVKVVDQYGGANLGSESTGIGRGVVFLAWGNFAAERVSGLDKSKHLVLTSAHPSPYSAHKGFLGNGHFKKANEWLESKYGPESKVDWCRLEA
ncbi:uracil DNA glycosylase [Marasmius tenuissimus]|nr:uracil DNA glycosylase [Marasmius tenuissimus]